MLRGTQADEQDMKKLSPGMLLFSSTPSPAQSRIAIPSYQGSGKHAMEGVASPRSSSVGILIVNLKGDDTAYHPSVDPGGTGEAADH